MRRVAQTLEVSRSQLHERLRHGTKLRRSYRKSDDAQLLEPVRRLVDERPTYRDRRISGARGTLKVPARMIEQGKQDEMLRVVERRGRQINRIRGRCPRARRH